MTKQSLKIEKNSTIRQAIKKILENNYNFLLIMDNGVMVGVLSKNLILSSLLTKINLDDKLSSLPNTKPNFEYISLNSNFDDICEKFRVKKVDILPILDSERKLINILTKNQFQVMMLEGVKLDLTADFSKFDNISLNHDIYNRPWGFYKSTVLASNVQAKIICVFAGSELSLQEHKKREEHWVIIKGSGQMILGESKINVYPGKYIYIPKGCKHQIINNSSENIIFSEVQLGEYFGEDDIIRYSDKYGRV